MLHRPHRDVVEHELDRMLYEMTQLPSYCTLELKALLRQFRDDAYETGYNKGYDEGYKAGFAYRSEEIRSEGYQQGYSEGLSKRHEH